MCGVPETLPFVLAFTSAHKFINIIIYEHVRSGPKMWLKGEGGLHLPVCPTPNPDCSYLLQISCVASPAT